MNDTAQVSLITGTSRGIGRFLAEHYCELGHRVIGCSRTESELQHPNYKHISVDITDEAAVVKLFQQLRREYGAVHNLINNAGIAAMNHALLTPMQTVQRVLNTNVGATFLFCREAAKLMQKSAFGRIVNFATVAVPLRIEGEAIYAASKAAVLTLTEILAKEFADFGVTVNSVAPTPIETDLIRNVPKEKISTLIQRQAIRRFGTFSDVANVIDFFLRKESSFITGQTLYLGGVC